MTIGSTTTSAKSTSTYHSMARRASETQMYGVRAPMTSTSPAGRTPVHPWRRGLDLGGEREHQLLLGGAGCQHHADREPVVGPVQGQRDGRHAGDVPGA